MDRRGVLVIGGLLAAAAATLWFRLHVTTGLIAPAGDGVIFSLRLVQGLAALTIGAALGVGGAILQSLLRNPLGEPWMLGLTSGSALAVAVWTYSGFLAGGEIVRYTLPMAPAVIGALAVLGLVYLLSQRRGFVDPASLVLIGVVVSVICAALTSAVRHLLPDAGMAFNARWMMGAISEDIAWPQLVLVGGVTILGTAVSAWLGPALDAASLGDDEARSVGVPLGALRTGLFVVAGVLTAGTVVLAGPIGFVGLICPHLARRLAGPSHRPLMIASALSGGALLTLADSLVTLIPMRAGQLPVGVLTALLGGPLFIVLLRRRPVPL